MKDKPKREMSPQFRAIKRQYASCFIILFASFLIGLAVRTILCMPLIITGKYLGAKKSKRDFAKVKGEREKQKSFDEHPLDL